MADIETQLSELMRQSLSGDQKAYRGLLHAVTPLLRSYFERRLGRDYFVDAEDLVQDTLIAVHTRRSTYDRARPFTAWLYGIARYKLIDHHRRKTGNVTLENAPAAVGASDGDAVVARLDLDRVLASLPDEQRQLLWSVKVDGETVAQAAARGGISEAAAKVRIHRAMQRLVARFGKS